MIVDAIFVIVEAVVTGFAALFPEGEVWALAQWIADTTAQLGALNYFLPIAELFGMVLAVIVLFPLFMGTTLTLWVWAQIRGSSARG